MDRTLAAALKSLLGSQRVAALATLHKALPAVSMVSYALLPEGRGFVIHVSRLATHTADMLSCPDVGLLVMAPPESVAWAQELPRVSLQGHARPCPAGSNEYALARATYLARFPQSEPTFEFADFSPFVVEVRSVRFVAGFGKATSILAKEFAQVMG